MCRPMVHIQCSHYGFYFSDLGLFDPGVRGEDTRTRESRVHFSDEEK
jgi:hypothetical protein